MTSSTTLSTGLSPNEAFAPRRAVQQGTSGEFDAFLAKLTPAGLALVYSFDANGNLQSGGGRTYPWNADN